ncbi:19629_t:CDS:2 [Rhizophagus irregularis]|nr:19629_t:CDS:2 [Rhizophagus irregularis]
MKILYEIKIVIFKYVENPISLALANRAWYTIFHDPHARSEWLLNKYGRAHALFHAVRLGRNFLTLDVIKCLMAKKAILSRYFVQRLMLQCGGCDGRLLELRNTLNVSQEDFKRLNSSQKHHWGYDLSVDVFIYILEEAIKLYESDLLFDFWVVLGRSGSQEWNIHLICKNKQEIRLNFLIKTHDSSILKASDPLAIPPQPKAKRIDINNVVTNEGDLLDMNNAVRTI